MDICFHFLGICTQERNCWVHTIIYVYYLQNCQTVFQSSCTILQSHQQCMRVLFSSYPLQHLSFEYLILVILMDVKQSCLIGWDVYYQIQLFTLLCILLIINRLLGLGPGSRDLKVPYLPSTFYGVERQKMRPFFLRHFKI